MNFHSFDNVIVWCILLLGLVTYQLLSYYIIRAYSGGYLLSEATWIPAVEIFIGALPLLGLLGTISGLFDTFQAMALGKNQEVALTQGISDALWTTQLGLVVSIPAWLLLGHLKHLLSKEGILNAT